MILHNNIIINYIHIMLYIQITSIFSLNIHSNVASYISLLFISANYSSSTDDSSDTDLVATEKRKKRKKPMKGGTKKKEKRSITTESGD